MAEKAARFAVSKDGMADCHITESEWPIWQAAGWVKSQVKPETEKETK
jgi:hypothetical protein